MLLQGPNVFSGQSFRVSRDSTLAVQVSRILLVKDNVFFFLPRRHCEVQTAKLCRHLVNTPENK